MSVIYDLIIYANGMQASLLLSEAVEKDLKVALVFDNDCDNNKDFKPFIITHKLRKKKFIFPLKSSFPIKDLLKLASQQIIQSNVKHYLPISFIKKIVYTFFNSFNSNKMLSNKRNGKEWLDYNTFKFSSNRITISFLKFAKEKGADIFQYSSLISSQYIDNQYYRIRFFDKTNGKDFLLLTKSILVNPILNPEKSTKPNNLNKISNTIHFTYPAEKAHIENIIFCEDKDVKIAIIPWFDFIDFKIKTIHDLSPDQAIQIINKNLDFIILEEVSLINFTASKKLENIDVEINKRLNFLYQNKQLQIPYFRDENCFNQAHKTIDKITRLLKKGNRGKTVIKKIILPGSNLGIEYNPLRIMEIADEKYDLAKQIIKSPKQFKKLFYRYGTAIDLIIDKAYEYWNLTKNMEIAWLKAEIWYCMEYEMCMTPESFINTYTHLWMDVKVIIYENIKQIFRELAKT